MGYKQAIKRLFPMSVPGIYILLATLILLTGCATTRSSSGTRSVNPMMSSSTTIPTAAFAVATLIPTTVAPMMNSLGTSVSKTSFYIDPQGRFSFTVPGGYMQAPLLPQHPEIVARFLSSAPNAGFAVEIQSLGSGATLDIKTSVVEQAASKLPGYQSITDKPITTKISRQEARQFEFFDVENNQKYHSVVTCTVHGMEFYTITLAIPEDYFQQEFGNARIFLDTFSLT